MAGRFQPVSAEQRALLKWGLDIGTASGDNEARIGSLTPTIVPL